MSSLRYITCPDCGTVRKIPLFWIIGIEGIFYCTECNRYFKINYKLGAILAGLGWALAWCAIQLLAFFMSAITLTIAVIAFIPLAMFFSFVLRRMLLKMTIRKLKKSDDIK